MDRNYDQVAILIAQTGPLNGQRWSLNSIQKTTVLIGRDSDCDIIVPDRQVSRHHIHLSHTNQGIIAEDLHSKNGTYINGQLLTSPQLLEDGDILQIALAQKFAFVSSDATLPMDTDFHDLQTEFLSSRGKEEQAVSTGVSQDIEKQGRLRLDKRSRRIFIVLPILTQNGQTSSTRHANKEVEIDPPLSASQFRLLELLYEQEGQVVSRQDLVKGVWGVEESAGVSEQAVDALVRRLRDRLASVDPTHNYIVTVRGHGLRLENP